MMKRHYEKLCVIPVELESCGAILNGSVSEEAPIDPNIVTVNPYDNGFESEPGGFKDINFN